MKARPPPDVKNGRGPETEAAVLVGTHSFLLLVAWHLFLVANIVTTSKALVTSSVALVPSSEHCYY